MRQAPLRLEGNDLLHVLKLTALQVKVLEGNRVIDRVSAAEAFRIARDTECIGSGTKTRVKAIRILRVAQWKPSYRTQGAPAIGPWAGGSPDWFRAYRTQG